MSSMHEPSHRPLSDEAEAALQRATRTFQEILIAEAEKRHGFRSNDSDAKLTAKDIDIALYRAGFIAPLTGRREDNPTKTAITRPAIGAFLVVLVVLVVVVTVVIPKLKSSGSINPGDINSLLESFNSVAWVVLLSVLVTGVLSISLYPVLHSWYQKTKHGRRRAERAIQQETLRRQFLASWGQLEAAMVRTSDSGNRYVPLSSLIQIFAKNAELDGDQVAKLRQLLGVRNAIAHAMGTPKQISINDLEELKNYVAVAEKL
jgi:hypothetical protein